MLCMSGSVRRPFTADNGRAIFRKITLNQPMGNRLTQTAGVPASDIDSNKAHDNGSTGTSDAGTSAVQVEI
jgi:hypothetical protein